MQSAVPRAFATEEELSTAVFTRYESNVQSYARAMPALFTRATGCEVFDSRERRYLDFLAGAGSLNYGHNSPRMRDALIDYIQANGITHSLDLHTTAKQEFLATFGRVILEPRQLDYVVQFTGPTGTNAVEAALKLARKVTGRAKIMHFTNSFHGASLGSLAVTGNKAMRKAAGVALENAYCMPFDSYFGKGIDTMAMIERLLDDPSGGVDLPAAAIVETVQGEGGVNSASIVWLRRLEALCRRLGVLLIVDDIQAGCGRTGSFFSFEPAGIKPDIVTLSKSLSGFGLPFSVVLIKREHDRWEPGEHNGTFRGNNHAFVTARAMIDGYWQTDDFANELLEKSQYLADRLHALVERFPGQLVAVKGRGLFQGVHFANADSARDAARRAFDLGLIIERSGPYDEVVKCMPPLTITKAELEEGLDILDAAVTDAFAAVRDGLGHNSMWLAG